MCISINGIVGSLLLVLSASTQAQPATQLKVVKVWDHACVSPPPECQGGTVEATMDCWTKKCTKDVPSHEDVAVALNDLKRLIQEAEVRARKREQALCKALGHTAVECNAAVPKAD